MSRYVRFVALLAVAGLVLRPAPALAAASPQLPPDSAVQRLLDRRVDAGGAVGLVVGLLDADGSTRVLHAGDGGEGTEPLGASSLFQIGSVSKVFTGTLLADMAQRGEVSPDDPIDVLLPPGVVLPPEARGSITLADLATHRSGLPGLPDGMPLGTLSDPYVDLTRDALFASVAAHARSAGEVRRFRYSNFGVGLLGQLLASRLGLSWEEAVRRRVLEPLGMTRTGLQPGGLAGARPAHGHDVGGLEVPSWNFGALAAAGGLHSTAADLLRFVAANVGEARTDLERAMRVAHHPRARLDHEGTVGLTWMVRSVDGRRTVWHNGAAGGYRAFLGFDPDRAVGVVVLANSPLAVDDLGFHLLNPATPLDPPSIPRSFVREAVPVSEATLRRYVGDYFVVPGAPLRVRVEEGRLWALVPGVGPHPAYGDGQGGFFLRGADVELSFENDASGEVALALIRSPERTVRALKVLRTAAGGSERR